MKSEPLLQVRKLQCSAGNRVLFENLELELFAGQCLLLLGPNGSGKTTLLRSLAGLSRPSAGSIKWQFPQADPVHAGRLYQGHNSGWKSELSARENLVLQTELDEANTDPAAIDSALERAGIAEQAELAFGRLSAGQRRRLALARLMLDSRTVWLLDEPATALDEQGLRLLARLLDQKLAKHGLVVTATHQDLGLAGATVRLNLAEHELGRA